MMFSTTLPTRSGRRGARFFVRAWVMAVVAFVPGVSTCKAQTSPAPANQNQSAQPASQNPKPGGQVIFSRSSDENGNVTTQVGPAVDRAKVEIASEPSVEDADRQAVTITGLDLDVHLNTLAHQIAVRAKVSVRNDGKTSLMRIPLQISSSLNWEQVRVDGRNVQFSVATLNSDADHTGQLHEAAIQLAQKLTPGAAVHLDVAYSGAIVPSAQRLVTIGTPEAVALHSDWDEISPAFVGLRGFGNVVWYPVSSVPVILGDGARVFEEIGRHKLHNSGCQFSIRLTVESPQSEPPAVALINGQPAPLKLEEVHGAGADVAGIATAEIENATLGFVAPSIFVAVRKEHIGSGVIAWASPENEVAVHTWLDATASVTPLVERWLGRHPGSQLTLLDLPDPDDAPYETGSLLAASLREIPAEQLNRVMTHALTHAYIQPRVTPSPAWLDEGLATFMESLWIEKRQGRDQALGMLENDRSALSLVEPASPGTSAGQPLASATEPVYYRTKAAYVFWMLRDLTSDDTLAAALRAYSGGSSNQSESANGGPAKNDGAEMNESPLQRLLKQAGAKRDLSWFFSDWVEADKGLPDLSIESVFPNAAQNGAFLVAVNVANAGYAATEVPVTVRSAKNSVTERVLVPARGKVVQRLLVMGAPTQVQVNDGTVPETQASVHVTDLDQAKSSEPPAGTSSSSEQPAAPQ
jgi:hypothetical protein